MRNWFVITGGPSSGKTKLINALAEVGVHVEHESARIVIDDALAAGTTLEELRADEQKFQEIVYAHKLEREARLDPNELIFFDRGMQDTAAYNQLYNFKASQEMSDCIARATYRAVFLLKPHAFEQDYARTESESQQHALFSLLESAYTESHVPVTVIPAFPTSKERVDYFLQLLRDTKVLA